MNKKNKKYFFRERNFSLLTFYFQNFMKGINLHQKSKKLEILMTKGWNICFWVKKMEWQVFAKIFHCGPITPCSYPQNRGKPRISIRTRSYSILRLFGFLRSTLKNCLLRVLGKSLIAQNCNF